MRKHQLCRRKIRIHAAKSSWIILILYSFLILYFVHIYLIILFFLPIIIFLREFLLFNIVVRRDDTLHYSIHWNFCNLSLSLQVNLATKLNLCAYHFHVELINNNTLINEPHQKQPKSHSSTTKTVQNQFYLFI